MLRLSEYLAEEYMRLHPNVSIYVYGGGTSAGVEGLISGDVDIGTASRTLNPREYQALAEKYNSVGYTFLVAKDALSIYVNPGNPVDSLSMSQLKQIFSGQITNWKEAGGFDKAIKIIHRPPNSGTRQYINTHILEGTPFTDLSVIRNTTAEVISYIASEPAGIGYGGIGYGSNSKALYIDGVEPSVENAINGTYPLTRYLYFYTTGQPEGLLKHFIDWVLSAAGQQKVKEAGYITLWTTS
jgi:phosphate transport system substrate-binding protein